jgi:hypothetical protein
MSAVGRRTGPDAEQGQRADGAVRLGLQRSPSGPGLEVEQDPLQ